MAQTLAAFRKDLEVFIRDDLGEERQREIFLAISREQIDAFEEEWRAALPGDPDFQRFIDGRQTDAIDGATLDSVIAERVRPIGPIVDRALELFELFTKVVTGESKRQIYAFVNDRQTPLGSAEASPGDQVVIASLSDWNWKGEVRRFNDTDSSGFSKGLFASIAAILKREYPTAVVPIRFGGRSFGGKPAPAVLIG